MKIPPIAANIIAFPASLIIEPTNIPIIIKGKNNDKPRNDNKSAFIGLNPASFNLT
ncbi:hypothetical protein ONA00_02520 [Mycoplasmopsis cynos]|uniref:hypothetical protein n=1 Tax=Mycoplasmopsis cynos TaxID=171284 RepID=UPI0024C9CB12|nr:hypothetical protein [Mycoplasmopsis cynos]WAM11320.1 hypothetical protein ONA00_02520 [Mycoplasmopsis cynos]